MIKDIIIKANDLLMRNAVRVFSKSKDKWIFEVFDESDNQKYTTIIQKKGCGYIWSCDCIGSTIQANNSWCCHKEACDKLLSITLFNLK